MNNNPFTPIHHVDPSLLFVGGVKFSQEFLRRVIKIVGPCPTARVFYPGGKYANALDLEE